jgi:hypothetical protein
VNGVVVLLRILVVVDVIPAPCAQVLSLYMRGALVVLVIAVLHTFCLQCRLDLETEVGICRSALRGILAFRLARCCTEADGLGA